MAGVTSLGQKRWAEMGLTTVQIGLLKTVFIRPSAEEFCLLLRFQSIFGIKQQSFGVRIMHGIGIESFVETSELFVASRPQDAW